MTEIIASKENKTVKLAASLKHKKYRDKTGLFIAEGEKILREIPESALERLIVSESRAGERGANCPATIVSDGIFAGLSNSQTPQGRLALCRKLNYSLEDFSDCFIIMCENLRDPGNLGTIMRTARALGAGGLILLKGSADAYNPKTVQAAAGAHFALPFLENAGLTEVIRRLKTAGWRIAAAVSSGGIAPREADFTGKIAIMIGNEGAGLTRAALEAADFSAGIPMKNGADSLNAAVSAAILMYEAVRRGE
ncbi:MAG: RNA methyltransferase [Clostridiales bacterium]|jgi:TrmH family RNA methyltransferase|nr:RNA methyltransferase [Clostridiales bacterium]